MKPASISMGLFLIKQIKMLNKPTQTRKFLGKTENFNSKQDQAFHQRMLKAYLQGAETFKFWGEQYQVNQKLNRKLIQI